MKLQYNHMSSSRINKKSEPSSVADTSPTICQYVANHPHLNLIGVWDHDAERLKSFANIDLTLNGLNDILKTVDSLVINNNQRAIMI